MRRGNKEYRSDVRRLRSTKDPRVTYKHVIQKEDTTWYFYLDGDCGAAITMEIPYGPDQKNLHRVLGYSRMLTPHAAATSLKGRGYASFVYQRALELGYMLVTEEHSHEAADLWDSLATRTGSRIVYVNVDTGKVSSRRIRHRKQTIFKVMLPAHMIELIRHYVKKK